MRAIYWFKRDLRLNDNRALNFAVERFSEVIPIFIFDRDILDELNSYDSRLKFIIEAIKNLKIKVYCFDGKTTEVLDRLVDIVKPQAIVTQKAYTWSGTKRVEGVKDLCKLKNIDFYEVNDGFISNIEKIPFKKVFTYFYKEWLKAIDNVETKALTFKIPNLNLSTLRDIRFKISNQEFFKPKECFSRIKNYQFENYENNRSRLDIDGTTKLSPCIRFGIISVRQIYNLVYKRSEQFIKELAWREFWYHLKHNYPEMNTLEFQEKRRGIRWENDMKLYNAFKEAKTGYPLIDAGIRQLITEKWMHNRMRMIAANFLTKILLMDWRIGESFFKSHLIDYDEVVNVGNWQWSASVGPDPKPFRIFNPILQARKFDPECKYIKKYIPELKNEPCEKLQDPLTFNIKYYKPIVNYFERVHIAKKYYKIAN